MRPRAPAIARRYRDEDRETPVMSTPYDNVSFDPGMGDSGQRVEIVEHDCPHDHCSFDRMLRHTSVSPVERDSVGYYCLNPNCPHYHAGEFDWAMSGPPATNPTVHE